MMKKVLVIATLIILVWGCTHKTAPQVTTQTAPVSDATTIAAGKDTYIAKCQRCHQLKDPADFTIAQWVPILDNMAGRAHLTDAEKANVMAYIQINAKR